CEKRAPIWTGFSRSQLAARRDGSTVADAYLAGVGRWVEHLRVLDVEREYPNLAKHLRRLAEDPAVRFARSSRAATTRRRARVSAGT
ncbi:MAG TPA: hypothetical protein VIL43_09145, partial [Burkholderiales bacterium]